MAAGTLPPLIFALALGGCLDPAGHDRCRDDRDCAPLSCLDGACRPCSAGTPPYQVLGVAPAIARVGDRVALEGVFAGDVTVTFPSPVSAPATGCAHRRIVTVPDGASSGQLMISAGGQSLPGPWLSVAPYAIAPGPPRLREVQAGAGHAAPRLVEAREGAAAVVAGSHLYVLGGAGQTATLASIEESLIGIDGSLTRFGESASLAAPRRDHAAIFVAGRVYVLGGADANGAALDTIESATFDGDTLGTFGSAGVALKVPRRRPAVALVGDALWVIGGSDAGGAALASAEHATIGPAGALGELQVATVSLQHARAGATALVMGDWLHVLGGQDDAGPRDDGERALLDRDGTVYHFMPGAQLPSRDDFSALAISGAVYLAGGGALFRADLDARGALGSFTQAAQMAAPRQRPLLAAAFGRLSLIGGAGDTSVEQHILDASGFLGGDMPDKFSLAQPRKDGAALVVGSRVFVFGGTHDGTGGLWDIESSRLGADGQLGRFAAPPGTVTRTADPRIGPCVAQAGPMGRDLYIVGGSGLGRSVHLPTVEHFEVDAAGKLSPRGYEASQLHDGRTFASCVVLGDWLYVLGGSVGTGGNDIGTASVERAAIGPDRSLGAFEVVPGAFFLQRARIGAASAVMGNFLYLFGGVGEQSIESAPILADESLGQFAIVLGVELDVPRLGAGAAAVGSSLYLIGGAGDGINDSIMRLTFDDAGNISFGAPSGSLAPRANGMTVTSDDRVYVMGGKIGAMQLQSIDLLPLR